MPVCENCGNTRDDNPCLICYPEYHPRHKLGLCGEDLGRMLEKWRRPYRVESPGIPSQLGGRAVFPPRTEREAA